MTDERTTGGSLPSRPRRAETRFAFRGKVRVRQAGEGAHDEAHTVDLDLAAARELGGGTGGPEEAPAPKPDGRERRAHNGRRRLDGTARPVARVDDRDRVGRSGEPVDLPRGGRAARPARSNYRSDFAWPADAAEPERHVFDTAPGPLRERAPTGGGTSATSRAYEKVMTMWKSWRLVVVQTLVVAMLVAFCYAFHALVLHGAEPFPGGAAGQARMQLQAPYHARLYHHYTPLQALIVAVIACSAMTRWNRGRPGAEQVQYVLLLLTGVAAAVLPALAILIMLSLPFFLALVGTTLVVGLFVLRRRPESWQAAVLPFVTASSCLAWLYHYFQDFWVLYGD